MKYKIVYSDGSYIKQAGTTNTPALFNKEQAIRKMMELSDGSFIVPENYVWTFNFGVGQTWATKGQRG